MPSMRPGSFSLRDLQPSKKAMFEFNKSFDLSNKNDATQMQAIVSGIVSGEYQDNDIQEFAKLYPETAPLISQALRQREVFKSNFQQPDRPNFSGAVNQFAGMGDIGTAKQVAQLAPDSGDTPSAIKEWKFYNALNRTDQARFLELKRQGYRIADIGGVPSMAPTVTGLPVVPLSTLGNEVAGKAAIEGGKKAAEVRAGAMTQADIDLGSNLDEINKMRTDVNGLISSKSFDSIYGIKRPLAYIPGTDAAGAEARRAQLEAATFGISIQKMKGLGQLSDAEGKKVTAAYTRAIDTRQSPDDAKKAWVEVLGYLDKAEQRAREKAGKPAGKSRAEQLDELLGVK